MDIMVKILEEYPDGGYLKVVGFDESIIGISSKGSLVYSINDIIDHLIFKKSWTYKQAVDYFYDHINNECLDDKAPIFITLIK